MRRLMVVLILAALLLPTAREPLAAQEPARRCFPETGACLEGRFLAYWEQNGGLPVFGLPLVPPQTEHNRDTDGYYLSQWLERARFELHPELAAPYDVLLGLVGKEQVPAWLPPETVARESGPKPGCRWFAETGHNVCDQAPGVGFKAYWEGHGLDFGVQGVSFAESLALFGLPLTAPHTVTNSSGDTVLTQWFERARFEWHPGNRDPYRVLVGHTAKETYDPANLTDGVRQYHPVSGTWPAPLVVPAGMHIDEVATGLRYPRFMALDPADGSLVVAEQTAGAVTRLYDRNGDGSYEARAEIASGLPVVHSVAFFEGALYAAAEDRIVKLEDFDATGRARRETVIATLPTGASDLYGHKTRTIAFGPDGWLYVSIGSSCDVCLETDPRRATIMRMRPDGSDATTVATGLRNTVGFAWHPLTGALWGVDMGRNNIGPRIPPDELNLIEPGRNYGWPYCYGANLPNPEFPAGACPNATAPRLDLPAHWAPLGLAFNNKSHFPATYQMDGVIAFHGAGADQMAEPEGYRVSRVLFDAAGNPIGIEDLVSGWRQGDLLWGRPAGVLFDRDGTLLISDDYSGRIYRLRMINR